MMRRGDVYYWRLAGTGLSFVAFGLGGLVLGLLAIPLLRLLPGAAADRRRRARRLVGGSMRAFVHLMRGLGVLSFRFEGSGRLGRPGQLIVANHPTLIDVVFLLGLTAGAGCVVKSALWRNPFTRWGVAAAGYIRNEPTERMIEATAQALLAGEHVIMFPEGTRTRPGQPLQLHRGAATIAIKAATVVTPVYIRCRPPTLAKHSPWYRIAPRRPHFDLRVGADIDPAPFRATAPAPRAARAFHAHLHETFTTELAPVDRVD